MHDLRSTYCTVLLKNDFSSKVVSMNMGHASEIITIDVYGDNKQIISDCLDEIEPFIESVAPKKQEKFGDEFDFCIDKNLIAELTSF